MPTATNEVWFVLPTANAENCARKLPAWRDQGYRVALLQDRARFDAEADAVITVDRYPGWAGSVNTLFREAVPAGCRVIVAGGDDMLPDPGRRASEIADEFLDRFGGDFGVMQPTGDAFEATETICGSPWIGRSWMARMYAGGGGLCDAYHQQYADDELYWVSRCAGRFWARPDLTQHHDHFRRHNRPAPGYWVDSAAAHDESDCLTFIARSRAGFPGAAPVDEPGLLDLSVFRSAYTGRAEAWYRSRYGGEASAEPAKRLRDALRDAAERGLRRIALYGAGQHTARAGDALRSPPVEIVAVIDDDPARIGTRLWNYPVVSRERALALDLDAVVLSSDAMEPALRERAGMLAGRGIEIIGLYGTAEPLRVGA